MLQFDHPDIKNL
jgi:hypothetical protein